MGLLTVLLFLDCFVLVFGLECSQGVTKGRSDCSLLVRVDSEDFPARDIYGHDPLQKCKVVQAPCKSD